MEIEEQKPPAAPASPARRRRGRFGGVAPLSAPRSRDQPRSRRAPCRRKAVGAVHEVVEIHEPDHQETHAASAHHGTGAGFSATSNATASRCAPKRTRAGRPRRSSIQETAARNAAQTAAEPHRRRDDTAARSRSPARCPTHRRAASARVQRTVVRDIGGETPSARPCYSAAARESAPQATKRERSRAGGGTVQGYRREKGTAGGSFPKY